MVDMEPAQQGQAGGGGSLRSKTEAHHKRDVSPV